MLRAAPLDVPILCHPRVRSFTCTVASLSSEEDYDHLHGIGASSDDDYAPRSTCACLFGSQTPYDRGYALSAKNNHLHGSCAYRDNAYSLCGTCNGLHGSHESCNGWYIIRDGIYCYRKAHHLIIITSGENTHQI